MAYTKVYQWTNQNEQRKKIIIAVHQPITAKQISRITGIPADTCSYILAKCSTHGLLTCLNPKARSSRLYWLTRLGHKCRKRLHKKFDLPYKEAVLPDIDWTLYGYVCFAHRSAVMKVLVEPMQPSQVKRFLRAHHPNQKISANNIRDIVRLLLAKKILTPVKVEKKAHPRYALTALGNQLRQLLLRAEAGFGDI